jgi:anti-sigma factor RsiW
MSCSDIRVLRDGYLDAALGADERRRVEEHLVSCPTCRGSFDERQSLVQAVQSAPYYRAPAELASWAGSVGREERLASPRRITWSLAASVALVLSLGAAIGIGTTYWLVERRATHDLAGEVVASYIRSQQVPERVTDVASSDRHTVKPWFNGKVDFAPPVQDFTADGFPLVGGRLDYVGGRAVAVLVYRHRQHIINLVTWPADGQAETEVSVITRQGYTLLRWRREHTTHWLISDVNTAALGSFSDILRRVEPAR